MKIFPAIDLYGGKAVRLYKGSYSDMMVYSNDPLSVALDFVSSGASHIHIVDLEGAKSGDTPNIKTIQKIASASDAFIEVGGGIRNMKTVDEYLSSGVSRVILGTAAVTDRAFLLNALQKYGDKIAVGVDIKDGVVAIKGWCEKSSLDGFSFCNELSLCGVKCIICTDISRDGAMKGANHSLYEKLSSSLPLDIIASGGISSLDDVKRLASLSLYGAIIGKAYYEGAISLKEAINIAEKTD